MLAGAAVLGIGRLVGPDSRAPLYWGLLLVSLSLLVLRGALVDFKKAEAAEMGTTLPEGTSPVGILLVFLPVLLSLGMLLTDPAPPLESIYLISLVWWTWAVASLLWSSFRARWQALGDPDPARRMPAAVRLFWPMIPGAVLLAWSVTAPGSETYGCDDGATCFEGPISWVMPGFILLIGGVVLGVVRARGSSIDKTVRLRLPGFAPKGDDRLARLTELGRLRSEGVLDREEFERLKAEVMGGGEPGAPPDPQS
jgi:hypothetical protein